MPATPTNSLVDRFPDVLRELRQEKGLSQEGLAEKAGLHRTYISQIERGIKSRSLRSLEQLAQALGVSMTEVVRRLEEA